MVTIRNACVILCKLAVGDGDKAVVRQAHQPGSGSTGSPTRQWFDRLTNQAVVRQAHQPGSGSTGSP
ncbi:hypothetical protein, partial [Coleofasciculus sp. F4-SAH-05]|uniref:hypothetical protein n=1 Tax=Coleofasciculus sp. F4-SAH-05 TaxID=3069525 RepID=UPI0032FBA793